jgi:RNA polymerase sigma factor (sigma-70 family)
MASDVFLWAAFREGDDTAFEQLYRLFYPVLFRYGRSLSHDDDLVRDGLHDLFLNLHRYRATLSATADPKLYLLGALRRTLADQHRRDTNRQVRAGQWVSSTETTEAPADQQLTDQEHETEQTRRIRQAFEQLPGRQREAIHLRYFVGLDYPQIADIMQVNYQSVLNFVQRGLRRMEQQLGNDPDRVALLLWLLQPAISIILEKFFTP